MLYIFFFSQCLWSIARSVSHYTVKTNSSLFKSPEYNCCPSPGLVRERAFLMNHLFYLNLSPCYFKKTQSCNSPTCLNIKTTHCSFCKMQVDTGYYSASVVKATSIRPPTQCVRVKYTGKLLMLCKAAASP